MLNELSTQLADVVEAAAPSVVQVHGRRRPASGLVYAGGAVLTTMRAIGREDGLHVRTQDGEARDAELAGWDPSTNLAVLRVTGLDARAFVPAADAPRVGQIAIAVGRSWSNAVTASAGIISVIGGPLRTGRRLAIEQVIRTTAPMHDGFTGGAFLTATGSLAGVTTAAEIRGMRVVIPSSIAWKAAASILQHGVPRRGYLGIAGQAVTLTESQQQAAGRDTALLVVGVTPGSAAESAGVLVGDTLIAFDGNRVESPEDLLDLLGGDAIGRTVTLKLLRGGTVSDLAVTVGERSRS